MRSSRVDETITKAAAALAKDPSFVRHTLKSSDVPTCSNELPVQDSLQKKVAKHEAVAQKYEKHHQQQVRQIRGLENRDFNETTSFVDGDKDEPRQESHGNLFLGGLSTDADVPLVSEYFSQFGELEEVRVPPHPSLAGKSRGYGFVTYKAADDAARVLALSKVKPHELCGQAIDLKYAVLRKKYERRQDRHSRRKPTQQQQQGPERHEHKRDSSSISREVYPHAESKVNGTGCPSQCNSIERTEPGSPGLFQGTHVNQGGGGEESTASSTSGYITSTPGTLSSNSSIATDLDATVVSAKIFVGGLASAVTDATLSTYFSQFGSVKNAIVMIDRLTSHSRGFGFVTFDEEDAVHRVLINCAEHQLLGKRVEVKQAIPRELLEPQPTPSRAIHPRARTQGNTKHHFAQHQHQEQQQVQYLPQYFQVRGAYYPVVQHPHGPNTCYYMHHDMYSHPNRVAGGQYHQGSAPLCYPYPQIYPQHQGFAPAPPPS